MAIFVAALVLGIVILQITKNTVQEVSNSDTISSLPVKKTIKDQQASTAFIEPPTITEPEENAFERTEFHANTESLLGGSRSVGPAKPYDVYLKHIDDANAGEPISMYWVSTALENCSGLIRDDVAHAQYISSNVGMPELAESFSLARGRCRSLWNALPDIDLSDTSLEWLNKASIAGLAIASIELMEPVHPG